MKNGLKKIDIVTVKISETDEVNLLGRLLEKYVPDSKYNPEDKTWHVPKETVEKIMNKH